jgi:UDP-N-acetylmuramoylalanine--D-glutamate ligase
MKKLTVLGLGKSGISAANLAVKRNFDVFASDAGKKIKIKKLNKKVKTEFGGHSDKILNSDIIIKSPGIHSNIPILKEAAKKGIKILSELDFALLNSKYKQILAVTGTNGKTTVTDLLFKIIKSQNKNSIVCGNIGFPLSNFALKTRKSAVIIMELSSYQLEDSPDFHPNISILLNITPDHLEHHKSMKNYIKAKENIFKNQTKFDFAIVNYDDKISRKLADKVKAQIVFFSKNKLNKGVFYDDKKIVIKTGKRTVIMNPKINIVGRHNIENILAAAAAAFCAGINPKTIETTISKYKGVEHRIEFVRKINGISFYNDSKSTNVDSTRAAIESFDKNILLILGGRDKGVPYTGLRKLVKEKVKAIFLVGESAEKIKKDLKNTVKIFNGRTVKTAVFQALKISKPGDTVLLSPACASFDQFENFEKRGEYFKFIVGELKNNVKKCI